MQNYILQSEAIFDNDITSQHNEQHTQSIAWNCGTNYWTTIHTLQFRDLNYNSIAKLKLVNHYSLNYYWGNTNLPNNP